MKKVVWINFGFFVLFGISYTALPARNGHESPRFGCSDLDLCCRCGIVLIFYCVWSTYLHVKVISCQFSIHPIYWISISIWSCAAADIGLRIAGNKTPAMIQFIYGKRMKCFAHQAERMRTFLIVFFSLRCSFLGAQTMLFGRNFSLYSCQLIDGVN